MTFYIKTEKTFHYWMNILDFMSVQRTLVQIDISMIYTENQSTARSNEMLNQSISHSIKHKLLQIVLYILSNRRKNQIHCFKFIHCISTFSLPEAPSIIIAPIHHYLGLLGPLPVFRIGASLTDTGKLLLPLHGPRPMVHSGTFIHPL